MSAGLDSFVWFEGLVTSQTWSESSNYDRVATAPTDYTLQAFLVFQV